MSRCPLHDVLDPALYGGGLPLAMLHEMRTQHGPVVRLHDGTLGYDYWAVLGRRELDAVSKNPALFSSAEQGPWPNDFDQMMLEHMVRAQLIGMDPPRHQKYRRVLRDAFTPRAVDSYEPRFRAHARRIIDAVAQRGECEFVEEVAAELPLLAILELMGIPVEERKQFFDWTNTMSFADDPDVSTSVADGQTAAANMLAYGYDLAANRREQLRGTIVEKMLEARIDGRPLTEEEFGWTFLLVIVGGNESTRSVTANGMRLLMENPEQLDYLVANPRLIPQAIEEMLRYSTAFITMRRTAMQDTELGGVHIARGDKLILHYPAANIDPAAFGEDALRFDIRRPERMPELHKEHRAFGYGQHFCIGAHLARLELRVMFEELLPRLRNPRFDGAPRFMRSNFVNSVKEMRIRFDPETAKAG
jgi:cholest-4-en-3-one 26-monooxygenase